MSPLNRVKKASVCGTVLRRFWKLRVFFSFFFLGGKKGGLAHVVFCGGIM